MLLLERYSWGKAPGSDMEGSCNLRSGAFWGSAMTQRWGFQLLGWWNCKLPGWLELSCMRRKRLNGGLRMTFGSLSLGRFTLSWIGVFFLGYVTPCSMNWCQGTFIRPYTSVHMALWNVCLELSLLWLGGTKAVIGSRTLGWSLQGSETLGSVSRQYWPANFQVTGRRPLTRVQEGHCRSVWHILHAGLCFVTKTVFWNLEL